MSDAIARNVEDFGLLFLMAFDGNDVQRDVIEFFNTFKIGGVILFEDNYENPDQLRTMINRLQRECSRLGEPLLIAVDQEGGDVQRFKTGFTRLPSAAELGDLDPAETEAIAFQAAKELSGVGVNLNLAPVADLCARHMAGAIGSRSFGADPAKVSNHVVAAVRGFRRGGILSCVKHFPGHGSTSTDSRQSLPTIDRGFSELQEKDLVPFRAAIEEGVDVVMTAHANYADCPEPKTPATLSRFWCTTVLREQFRFSGVILTDALEMKALDHMSPVECGAAAFAAGADLLLYYREAHQFTAFATLRERLEQGAISQESVSAKLQRMRQLRSKLTADPPPC
jgi:beta-N-acetylhexosaminidase